MRPSVHHLRASSLAVIAFAAVLGGCSATTEDPGTGAVNTGAYPNLNIKPGIAADQFTPQERAAKGAALRATQSRAVGSGGRPPANEQARLAALARSHGKTTLDQIEKADCSPRPTCD